MTDTRRVPPGWEPAAWSSFVAGVDSIWRDAVYADPAVFKLAVEELAEGVGPPIVPPPTRKALVAVARKHRASSVGFGEAAYDVLAKTAYYIAGEWTDTTEIERDFLSVDDVEHVVVAREAIPEGWWQATVVWPEDPPSWVVDKTDAASFLFHSVLAMARAPLVLEPVVASAAPSNTTRSMPFRIDVPNQRVLTASGEPVPEGWLLLERFLAAKGAVEADLRRAGRSTAPMRGFARVDMRTRQVFTRDGRRVAGGYDAVITRLRSL